MNKIILTSVLFLCTTSVWASCGVETPCAPGSITNPGTTGVQVGNQVETGSQATNQGNTQQIVNKGASEMRYGGSYQVNSVPGVIAPALTTSVADGVCMGSSSGGAGWMGFGGSAASTWLDKNCNTRQNARLVYDQGAPDVAKEITCSSQQIFEAYAAVGRPCRLTYEGATPLPGAMAASFRSANPDYHPYPEYQPPVAPAQPAPIVAAPAQPAPVITKKIGDDQDQIDSAIQSVK